ncbi:hemerythrin domain-containing protein [Actinocorallia longicatena]|uniref:Hemerythrin domain-containing protein n=1 Tax=Actinocorallia longicatena TaxID=111803 RepID=A0ABP6QSI9_9ACTN
MIDRVPREGGIDFTMMYAAHDAFERDLRRMADAARRGLAFTVPARQGWALFTRQLHLHHGIEDRALWPALRERAAGPEETAVLDAMELEHLQIDPRLEEVEKALSGRDLTLLTRALKTLTQGLTAHMRHEETAALPLVEARLGPDGWAAFGRAIRKEQGLSGAKVYFPWLLDGAPEPTRRRLTALLPPPVRLLNARVWTPRYRSPLVFDDGPGEGTMGG